MAFLHPGLLREAREEEELENIGQFSRWDEEDEYDGPISPLAKPKWLKE